MTIVAVALVLTALHRLTRSGLATRAAAVSPVGALLSGLSPDRVAIVNWAISSVTAGLVGVLIAPLVPLVPGSYRLDAADHLTPGTGWLLSADKPAASHSAVLLEVKISERVTLM